METFEFDFLKSLTLEEAQQKLTGKNMVYEIVILKSPPGSPWLEPYPTVNTLYVRIVENRIVEVSKLVEI
jgi:hypothetical protein